MLALFLWLWLASPAAEQPSAARPAMAAAVAVPKPAATSTCPVCGMFVAKYPQWVATVVWRDGTAAHFDGAKDMFTYVLTPGTYAKGRAVADIATIAVTEFYDLRAIDAREAYFVVGSDVLGPMGREFIPLATRADAAEFLRDHDGSAILTFTQVTLQVVREVDEGRR